MENTSLYKRGFEKRAALSMTNSMDIMPNLVRGNNKLQKIVNNILDKRIGSRAYSDAVQSIKKILVSVKNNGANHPETKEVINEAMGHFPGYQILSKTPNM